MHGEKEKWTYTGKNKRRSLVIYPTIVNLYTKYELSVLYSCGDIFNEKYWEKEKKNKYREEQTGECSFSIPQYSLPLLTCIPNMKVLSWMVLEISLTKNYSTKCKGEKEKWTYTGKNNQEKAGFLSNYTTCHCQSVYKIWTFCVTQLRRYLWRKICRERKKNKYREEQAGEGSFSVPRYNLSLSTCILNMKFLS